MLYRPLYVSKEPQKCKTAEHGQSHETINQTKTFTLSKIMIMMTERAWRDFSWTWMVRALKRSSMIKAHILSPRRT